MSGTRSSSGLVCSHGSHMDEKIPRPKMPKTALPPELRAKLGLAPRKEENESSYEIYKPGAGVLAPVGSGKDGSYLKMKSSIPMSHRTSGLARMKGITGTMAVIPRARLRDSEEIVGQARIKK
eukprot:gene24426-29524_t